MWDQGIRFYDKSSVTLFSTHIPMSTGQEYDDDIYITVDNAGFDNPYFFQLRHVFGYHPNRDTPYEDISEVETNVIIRNIYEKSFKETEEIILKYVNSYLTRFFAWCEEKWPSIQQ